MTATKEQQSQRQNQPQQDEVGSCLSHSLFSSSCSYLVFFHPTLPPSPSRALTLPRLDAAFQRRPAKSARAGEVCVSRSSSTLLCRSC